ncbi:Protein kinase capable of phosphorylating tyrosine family protein [Artemisia annua]|uniref:Protein kinase capable of phosphorylating tyrosine family protein n=1 Tax=Artemisia annua TaxID=35608 RepID=A0A2U1Q466_ARTAN|nr:Protein kinase capable of phosphorylating tyrosine family protein [Artemisia annua]
MVGGLERVVWADWHPSHLSVKPNKWKSNSNEVLQVSPTPTHSPFTYEVIYSHCNNDNQDHKNPSKSFSFLELQVATRNFRPSVAYGSYAGSSTLYKGWIDEQYAPGKFGIGIPVAIKRLKQSLQGDKEWLDMGKVPPAYIFAAFIPALMIAGNLFWIPIFSQNLVNSQKLSVAKALSAMSMHDYLHQSAGLHPRFD